ncbi:unnamed protein product [Arctia plantaginis]|uniref:Uncharacterized protein n=1 Tax=Arctia plantaginis TaxID=874455 RepID=A0A8S1AKJ1_ARCPL|nr:unnamed protein product [Arctia plantaginis]
MSRSRRTLLSIFVFLSFNDGFVLCQIRSGTLPTSPEDHQNFKSHAVQPGNLKPDFLSAAQRLLAGAQRPTLNDFSTQPFITKPPVVTIEPSYQQIPVNVNPAPNLPIQFTSTTCNTDSSVISSPETLTVETVEPTPSITVSSVAPSTLDYPSAVDQNYVRLNQMSLGQISQTFSMPETLRIDNFVQQPQLPQIYQPPGTVQATPIPVVTPFASYANSVSSVFPQYDFMGASDLVPTLYPETIDSQQTPAYVQTETAPVSYASNVDCGSGYTVPLSLQINMPSPTSEQPIIFLSPPTPATVHQDTSYISPLPPMVPPLIVMESSRSKWRNILPLLLIALCDGGSCKNSGSSGCSGSCNIPIPYPIPIPTNNPIILSRGNKKRKEASHSDED